MFAGDPALRTTKGTNAGICHRCMGNGEGFAPCDSKDSSSFPPKPCPGGIRSTIIFPQCWDGKNLDSPDHQSHMFNTIKMDGFTNAPPCPASHPVRMPQVTYETVWDVRTIPLFLPFRGNEDYPAAWKSLNPRR